MKKNYIIIDTDKSHKHLNWVGFRWLVAYTGGEKRFEGNIMGSFQTRTHAKMWRDYLNELDYYN